MAWKKGQGRSTPRYANSGMRGRKAGNEVVFLHAFADGVNAYRSQVLQIGAVVVDVMDGWMEVDSAGWRVQLPDGAREETKRRCGYAEDRWAGAMPEEVALAKLGTFLDQHRGVMDTNPKDGSTYSVAVSAAWNSNASTEILTARAKQYKSKGVYVPLSFKWRLDVCQLARYRFLMREEAPVDMKLTTIGAWYGLYVDDEYDSVQLARLTADVAHRLCLDLGMLWAKDERKELLEGSASDLVGPDEAEEFLS